MIEQFVDSVSMKAKVDAQWQAFVAVKQSQELEGIIAEENLNAEAAREFIGNAFRDGSILPRARQSPKSCRRYRDFPRTTAMQPRSRRCWTSLLPSLSDILGWFEQRVIHNYVSLPFGEHMGFLIGALDGDPSVVTARPCLHGLQQ